MKKIFLLFILMLGTFLHPYVVMEIEAHKFTGKLSSGYDDNVYEEPEKKTGRSFVNFYVDSKFQLPQSKRLGAVFRLQNGLKTIGGDEDVALSKVNVKCAFLISPKVTSEILNEVKHKYISTLPNTSIQSEYGYLYWHSGLSFNFRGEGFTTSIRYLHGQRDYKIADFTDSITQQIQLETKVPFSQKLLALFAGRVETLRLSWQEETSFPEETTQRERIDNLYELSIGVQWFDGILINPIYTYRKDGSQGTNEYSFYAHQLAILAALPFRGKITMQIYGCIQLREYDSQKTSPLYPAEEDDTDQLRNLLIFSLSKDIFKSCSLEARYLFSHAELSSSSGKYKKQSYSLGVCYSF